MVLETAQNHHGVWGTGSLCDDSTVTKPHGVLIWTSRGPGAQRTTSSSVTDRVLN